MPKVNSRVLMEEKLVRIQPSGLKKGTLNGTFASGESFARANIKKTI
jgi:hypothetical protein